MSAFGVQVKIQIAVEVSVLWSVRIPLVALAKVVKTILSTINQLKEAVMLKLHEMVLLGVALLSVPGRIDESQFG